MSFASGDTHVAHDMIDVVDLKEQQPMVSIGVSPLDVAGISTSRMRPAMLPKDVLPDIFYGDVGGDSTCHSASTDFSRPAVEMKSSVSYCSDLTDLTHVDDGLTDWGLPKVLVTSYDEEVVEDNAATVASFTNDNVCQDVDMESLFDVDLPLPAQPSPQTSTISKTMSVVYLAMLLQKKGITPARYQPQKPLRSHKSLAQLCKEARDEEVKSSFLATFVPIWV